MIARVDCVQIVVFDKLDYCASLANIRADLEKPNCTFVRGDIQVADLVSYVLQQHDIETVMHCAAQSHVDNSFGNSLAFTMNNTYGTHVLLESCRMYGNIKRFINVSTDEVRCQVVEPAIAVQCNFGFCVSRRNTRAQLHLNVCRLHVVVTVQCLRAWGYKWG